jgi:polyketide biosynthesis acyl carrier protein
MTRDQILALARQKAGEIVPDLDLSRLDTSKSLKDYGASSLDLVEITSALMRELRVKVPRAELNTISNIDGLVDLLDRIANGPRTT